MRRSERIVWPRTIPRPVQDDLRGGDITIKDTAAGVAVESVVLTNVICRAEKLKVPRNVETAYVLPRKGHDMVNMKAARSMPSSFACWPSGRSCTTDTAGPP